MPTGSMNTSISLAGIHFNSNLRRTATGQIAHQLTLPSGSAGTLTTRTDDDTGVATVDSGHGITTQDTVDVYWADGVRYGMSVSDVNGDDITIDLGAGDVLPAEATALVVTSRVEIDTDFDGDLLKIVAVMCSTRAHIEFLTEADASIHARELDGQRGFTWVSDEDVANPLAGTPVGKMQVSCGLAVGSSGYLQVGVLYDSEV